jgi:hypothetical protein
METRICPGETNLVIFASESGLCKDVSVMDYALHLSHMSVSTQAASAQLSAFDSLGNINPSKIACVYVVSHFSAASPPK